MDKRYEELLQHVQRPGRYIGGEINAIIKDWDTADLKVALVFPDIYDIGMSHLGMKVLYHILNSRPDILCERAFAPWPDMERLLREKNLPIVTLENKKPLKEFDIIGFSLSHELSYTNVLNILNMSGIPLRSKEREASHPLIIAGGPCAFNPEPMSDFIDLFLIGDGENAILEISDCCLSSAKGKNAQKNKKDFLKEFSKIEGVYVPELPAAVRKRTEPDLDKCFYPARQILPYVPIVHDRISLEIMRGCPHRCRFCQATTLYSPRRTRSKDALMRLARETQKKTGQDEISLLSLSTGDYPGISDLLDGLTEEFKPKGVSISLPSLRIEKGIKDLPPVIRKIKKTGFTFAPEVGSGKLRRFINKNIDSGNLVEGAKAAYESGWKKIKLYFMVGFPGEDNKDLDGIIEMAASVAGLRPANRRRGANVTISVSSFIPKPHTPFQWEPMASRESLAEKINYIKRGVDRRRVTISTHNIDMSILEGVLSRGDRRLSGVIEGAFLKRARFDNWTDLFTADIWTKAFLERGIDPADYLRRRRHDEPLPWEHIHSGTAKDILINENISAHRQATIPI